VVTLTIFIQSTANIIVIVAVML